MPWTTPEGQAGSRFRFNLMNWTDWREGEPLDGPDDDRT